MDRLQINTLTNQNISSYLLADTYTADSNHDIIIRCVIDQVAGNGDYSIYVTVQQGGTGSAYTMPITTFTVPSGTTAIGFPSIVLPMYAGDVAKVYVKGLAGDTTTPDIITSWYNQNYVQPAIDNRKLSVGANGEVWLGSAYDTYFTRIDVAVSTRATQTSVDAIPTNPLLTNDSRLNNLDAAVSTRLPTASYTTPPTSSAISSAVWDEVLTGATHNIAGSAGKRLRQLASNIIYSGTIVSSTENIVTLDSGAASVNGAYDPAMLVIISGNGIGQCRGIYQYAGATRQAAVDRDFKTIPQAGDEYMILAWPGREEVNEGLAQGATTNTITLNGNASAADNAYVGQLVFVRSGLGEDQVRLVTAYNGTTKIATVSSAWDVIPDTTSAYVMLPTKVNLPSENAAAVWNYNDKQLTSFGTLVEDIWNYSDRLLTDISNLASQIASAVWDALIANYLGAGTTGKTLDNAGSGNVTVNAYVAVSSTVARSVSTGSIGLQTHYTLKQSITSTLTDDLASATKVWLAIKANSKDADNQAILLLEKTAGLTVLAGATYGTPADGALAVNGSSGAWSIDFDVQEAATGLLDDYAEHTYRAELKALLNGDTICIWSGNADLAAGIVQSV